MGKDRTATTEETRPRHVFEFLGSSKGFAPASVMVLYGDDVFLMGLALDRVRTALLGDDGEPPERFSGDAVAWCDVMDGLRTVSLFGNHVSLVIVDDADSFITQHREALERYLDDPSSGWLVLMPRTWLATTRLHKKLLACGLIVDCSLPKRKFGSTATIDRKALVTWLTNRAKSAHGLTIDTPTVTYLVELAGDLPGVVDQEFAKLATYLPSGEKVTKKSIDEIGCGWNLRTTWDLLDAVLEGNAAEALAQLHRLMQAGQEPIAILGAFSWSLRRFAAATQWSDWQARTHNRRDLAEALRSAGFRNDFQASTPVTAERQLRQIGWDRCQTLYRKLLRLDLRMKLSHSDSSNARRILEEAIVELSAAMRRGTAEKSK